MDVSCADCGKSFVRIAGPGRPRIRCEACSPVQRSKPRERIRCAECSVLFRPRGAQKFCSRSCRDKGVWARQKAANPCPKCGGPMSPRGPTRSDNPTCRACQRADHGEVARYKLGCRCDSCKAAKRADNRAVYQARKAEGRPTYRAKAGRCDYCSADFLGRAGQRFCSADCARDSQGRSDAPRFKVAKSLRLAIYEADGWTCQLCEQPVRDDVDPNHPRYPTLDHIVPRARGGSDDRENLRLACRQCNTLRGTDVDWVPVRAVA